MVYININNSISLPKQTREIFSDNEKDAGILIMHVCKTKLKRKCTPGPAVFPPIAAITWLKKVATDCSTA
jgi:hypothetical protein